MGTCWETLTFNGQTNIPLNNNHIQSTVDISPTQSTSSSRWCHCVIDLSTPATLERDFYAWLNVRLLN